MVTNIIHSNNKLYISGKIFRVMPRKKKVYLDNSPSAKKFRKLERSAPNKIPTYTCPSIDKSIEQVHSLIKQLERLRKQNEKLRYAAEYWHTTAEWLCTEFLDKE